MSTNIWFVISHSATCNRDRYIDTGIIATYESFYKAKNELCNFLSININTLDTYIVKCSSESDESDESKKNY